MRVFLTGANGWIGSAIVQDLLDAGHSVVGLVRSEEKGEALAAVGAQPVIGGLGDIAVIRAAAEQADGIIHTAFGLDFSKLTEMAAEERLAIECFGEVFAGSSRPILVTGGILLTPRGDVFTEDRRPPFDPKFPRSSEQDAFGLAERGIHASAVRNPRTVHGYGEQHGFVPMLTTVAREKGVSAYVDDGSNLWPAVHRNDSARLYRLAIERGARSEAYHAVAEEGVPFKAIAEAIGRQIDVPTRSISAKEAPAHFGGLAMFAAGNGPTSSNWTRETLDWEPREIGLIADIERPGYCG